MSEIITFYSYKGGVGRTMALANISVILSRWGHKVLVVDWDLEAPGLEHFFKNYVDLKLIEQKTGVVDILYSEHQNWKESLIEINIPQSVVPIHLITSGKRDADYFKKVRNFNVDTFYENGGGEIIEHLRSEWLFNYDYVLVDSRTGITEIGGICTIQLPDTIVMLFTATNQGFDGVLDIIKRAASAQQKLPYDRQKLAFLPVPSKFETNTEFVLSQTWLEDFSIKLESTYDDWLPNSIIRKDFLDLCKIPYVAYFSFGEKLPVIEQGVKDPSGLGYAYESIALLIANHLKKVEMLVSNRDQYVADVNKFPSIEVERRSNKHLDRKLNQLKQKFNVVNEVQTEKSNEVVISCVERNIIPLFQAISRELKSIGSVFKNTSEKVIVIGDFITPRDFKLEKEYLEETYPLHHTLDELIFLFNGGIYDQFDLKHIKYVCDFRHLRKFKDVSLELSVEITVNFHGSVYEITSKDNIVNIDKLYHETITSDEKNYIIDEVVETLLEKIDVTNTIKYLSWGEAKWEARLDDISCEWKAGKLVKVSNPEFIHWQTQPHKSENINYLNEHGFECSVYCKSHIHNGRKVSFTFEPYLEGRRDSTDSSKINFMDWNGEVFELSIEPMVFLNDKSSRTPIIACRKQPPQSEI